MQHTPDPTPSLAFAMCVEAGGFESMAIRAAQSLRKFGGRFSNCKMYAVTPRLGAPLSNTTLSAFDDLGVEYLNIRPANPYAWYPLMNKPLTLVEVRKQSTAEQITFIDSDMIVMSEPNLLELDDDTDFVACAPDKNIGSASEDDVNTPFWKELCKVLGTSFDELPRIHAHRDNIGIKLYFNSGLFTFRRTGPFAGAYQDAVAKLLDAKLSSQVSNIYFHEQAAVGVVTVKEKLRWKPLPHEYNYAVGRKIMDKYEPLKVQHAVILHYHDMMWPENWDNLMPRLKADRPEIHDWLASLGPLKLNGSSIQKMTGKIIGHYRKRKMDAHKSQLQGGLMKLLIVIVNYKSADLTIDCLRSLEAEVRSIPGTKVIVTDNKSPDDSVATLRRAILTPSPGTPGEGRGEGDLERKTILDMQNHPEPLPEYRERGQDWTSWLTIQPLEKNGGFAYGNNAAIAPVIEAIPDAGSEILRRAGSSVEKPGSSEYLRTGVVRHNTDKPDFILLLNPDTIVRPGAIAALLDFMRLNPKAGIAGSRLEDPDGTPQRSAFRFHSIAGEFERGIRIGFVTKLLKNKMIAPPVTDSTMQCDWVAGASMLVRREVFEQAGLMDEKYFMYFEEVDFCLAAKRAGWSCWYVPASRVVHLVGAVSQMSDSRKHRKRRPAYWFESRRRYFVKNHGWPYAALADLSYLLAHSFWRLRRLLQRKEDTDPPKLLLDSVAHSVFVRGWAV